MAIVSGSPILADHLLQSHDSTGKIKASAMGLVFGTPSAGALPYFINSQSTGYISASTSGLYLMSLGAQAPDYRTVTQKVVQVVCASTSSLVGGTVAIPADDTIPQNTEGTEILTATITPTNANNLLYISFASYVGVSQSSHIGAALFQDSTAGALAGVISTQVTNYYTSVILRYKMTAGTTSSTTFKIRVGCDGQDASVNGRSSDGRKQGGVSSTILEIWEVTP